MLDDLRTLARAVWETLRAQVIRADPAQAIAAEEAFGLALRAACAKLD